MDRRPWTPDEDAVLHARYVRDGAAACSAALGRPLGSVTSRARRLTLCRKKRWTPRDDQRLRMLWGTRPIAHVAAMLHRTPDAIYERARHVGLSLGCPHGLEYLSASAVRTGYSTGQLRRILRFAGVRVHRASSRPGFVAKSDHLTYVVDPFDVDEAVTAWHQTETLLSASERFDVAQVTVERVLMAAMRAGDSRISPKPYNKHWRVHSAVVDELMADRARKETVTQSAARLRVTRQTLGIWFKAEGIEVERFVRHDPAIADAIVAKHRAMKGCKAYPHAHNRRRAA